MISMKYWDGDEFLGKEKYRRKNCLVRVWESQNCVLTLLLRKISFILEIKTEICLKFSVLALLNLILYDKAVWTINWLAFFVEIFL